MPWTRINPDGGSYTFQPGERYAVLASVSLNYALSDIVAKATDEGFEITYSWEEGQAATDPYVLNLPPDTRPNHRWVFAEGNFRGSAPWSLGVDSPTIVFVPTTVWHIDSVFQVTAAPTPAPTPPAQPMKYAPFAWAALAVAVGAAAWAAWTYRDAYLPRPKTA